MQNPGSILMFTYTGEQATTDTTSSAPSSSEETTSEAAVGSPAIFTAEQAARGKVAYESNCATCHGQNLTSATYGTPLGGAYFKGKWGGKTVGALYQYAHDKMPPSRPGALAPEVYADIIAYVLQVNGVPAGDTELPADVDKLKGMTIALGPP